MQRVLVLSSIQKPLMPCHPARARMLLRQGRAAVFRRYPFTVILKDRDNGDTQPLEFKADPGSKTTGIALVAGFKKGKTVIWASEIEHRGLQIKRALDARRAVRRSRRNRKTRYRQPRFDNRTRSDGWLPPSLMSRVWNIDTWAKRLRNFAPVTSVAVETIRFDTQKIINPEISGAEYQQGTLFGYEVREYLLEKWKRKCAYCGKTDVPFEVEHIVPRTRGGSNRVSNLTLACRECNRGKGNLTAEEFGYPDIQKQALRPLRDAAALNATRYAIGAALKTHGLPVSFWSGGRTKHNRAKQGYPKAHWIDAACVGESGEHVHLDPAMSFIRITATGHGLRQRCITDKYGFPRAHFGGGKTFMGFSTGDIVKAVIPKGKYAGVYVGRVTIRRRPSFRLNGFDVNPKYLILLQRCDGYGYRTCVAHSPSH